MTELINRLVTLYRTHAALFDTVAPFAELDAEQAEQVAQEVRSFAAKLVQAADELREAAGAGPRPTGRPRKVVSVEDIKMMRSEGKTIQQIAEACGVSKRTIYRALEKENP